MSGLERKPALPPQRTHPVADLAAAAATAAPRKPSTASRPTKDQLNVRINRDVIAHLDHAILVLSLRRGSKLTKAEAVEEAIADFLDRHQLNGQTGA